MESEVLEVVADVDHDRELIGTEYLHQALRQPGATDTACEREDHQRNMSMDFGRSSSRPLPSRRS